MGDRQEPTPGTGRVVRIVLFVSLAINLIVVGIVLGAKAGGHPMRHGMRQDAVFGPLTDGFSREERRVLRERFETASPGFRAERREVAADFRALAALLRAEVWDRAAAEAILVRQGDRMEGRMATGRAVLLEHLDELTPEARQALGAQIERRMGEASGQD
jgi:Spy/CpxP family protein refolding chaperone